MSRRGTGCWPGLRGFCLMLAHFSHFFALVAHFFDFFRIFWRVLNHLAFFSQFFAILDRFLEVLGRFGGGGVLEDFSLKVVLYFKNEKHCKSRQTSRGRMNFEGQRPKEII